MDRHELIKLLSDVSDHYKDNIGEHFAAAVNRSLLDLPLDSQKKELLNIIAQLTEHSLHMVYRATSGCTKELKFPCKDGKCGSVEDFDKLVDKYEPVLRKLKDS